MFNNDNIKIFDYIFSIGFIIENEKGKEYIEKLRKMFDSNDDEYSFWIDLMFLVSKGSVFDASNITSGHQIGYISFPKLTFDAKSKYKDFKKKQIIEETNNNGVFNKEIIDKVCKNMCNKAIKKILDYCEESECLKYLGEPYLWADNDVAEIIYENIEVSIPKIETKSIHNEINVYGSHNDFSNSTINQNINYNEIDDEIINTVKCLISELEDYKIDGKIINKLKEYSKKNKKEKLIDYLINVCSNISSSLIEYAFKYILIKFKILNID